MTNKLKPGDPKLEEYRGIPRWKIQRHARMVPIRAHLDKKYGIGNWGDDEIVDDMLERHARRLAGNSQSYRDRKKKNESVDKRLERYLEVFKNVTPNDLQSIRQMSEIEIMLEELAARRIAAPKMDLSDLTTISDMEKKLSGEHRQLQETLGISRARREAEIDAADELHRFADGARRMLREHGIKLACPHCKSKINHGFIVFHFREDVPWKFEYQCPNEKCGKLITLEGERKSDGRGQGVSTQEPEAVLSRLQA